MNRSLRRSDPAAVAPPRGFEIRPLPPGFLAWQVALRRHTMEAERGAPHVGVAPLVSVRSPGAPVGATAHSIICGLLPAPNRLEAKTVEFRALYEENVETGARAVYDRGIEYLLGYYDEGVEAFDSTSLTTLVEEESPIVLALEADPRSALTFHVFDLREKGEIGKLRCVHLECVAELHRAGPVRDNVWWHNTLFHGPMDDAVVIRFRHLRAFDTRFGRLEPLG